MRCGSLISRSTTSGCSAGSQNSSGIIKRTWVLRSDLDRSELRRTVEQSIAVLARLHGAGPTAYRLIYRPAGQEDAGYAQGGCVFSVPSILIGTLIGGLLVWNSREMSPGS